MKRSIINSLFLHLLFFIAVGLSYLFSNKIVILPSIQVSLVHGVLNNIQSYKPLKIEQPISQKQDIAKKIDSPIKNILPISNKSKLNYKVDAPNKEGGQEPKVTTKASHMGTDNKLNALKSMFANGIITSINKQGLSQLQLQILNNQIKGCWYGQGGYNSSEDLTVELILTMNADATINAVEVLHKDSYSSDARKVFLSQVLRALKDPKCKQLKLPMDLYSNWRIIHMTFNPKG